MKKLLILFSFLLLSGMVFAQNTDKNATYSPNDAIYRSFEKTAEAFRVTSVTSITTFYFKHHTSTSSTDSIGFGFTARNIQIINDETSSDTVFVSPSSSFPSSTTLKFVGGESITIPLLKSYLYVKFGTTATASKKLRVLAW